MINRRAFVAVLAAAAVAGCSGGEPEGELPDAQQLVTDASKKAAEIKSTHFALKTEGEVPGLAVSAIDGDMTSDGKKKVEAKGKATLAMFGQSSEVQFTLDEGTLYVDGLPGGQQKFEQESISGVYDFSAVLDAERGLPKLVGSVRDGKVSKATVADQPAYKVDGTVPKDAVKGLVPQVRDDVKGSLWIAEKSRQPLQAEATFGEGENAAKLQVTLSKINEPVTIDPPK